MTRQLRHFISLFIIALSAPIGTSIAAQLSPGLEQSVRTLSSHDDSLVNVLIILENTKTKDRVSSLAQDASLSRSERITAVVRELKSIQAASRRTIIDFIGQHAVGEIKEYWITPAVSGRLPLSQIDNLAAFDGVRLIVENAPLVFDTPVETLKAPQMTATAVSTQLSLMGIPTLWQRGLTGRGRLVCSFDTGVEEGHPALSSKWRGNTAPLDEAWFSKVIPDTLPYDKSGHGTHTMGIMVGSSATDTFGVAPDAEWITAAVIDQGRPLSTTISDILEAFQWSLNPDGDETTTDDVPDVILNSWGIPKGLFLPCDDTFWEAIDNVEAAGIVTIFAAGNEGPDARTMRSPADRASTPINSFAIGAVDNNKIIGSFSSRGPSSCDESQFKPEVVAPGVSVRSSYKGGTYVYMTGTSMAAPYVAGLVALIRQYNPDVTVTQIKNALMNSAEDLGAAGEDNAYGHGLVNASLVLDYIPLPVAPEFNIVASSISDDGYAFPGEQFGLYLTLNNPGGNISDAVGKILSTSRADVQLITDSAYFLFGAGGVTAINTNPFEIEFDASFYHGQEIALSLIVSDVHGLFEDTLDFYLTVGLPPVGSIALQDNGHFALTVSDFGGFGFAPGSIYNILGNGLTVGSGSNLLYEGGIVVGRNALQLSTSVRNQAGLYRVPDFTPYEPVNGPVAAPNGGTMYTASFNDKYGDIPIPINVTQETSTYDTPDDNGFVIVSYRLSNASLERITDLKFGFLCDLDLSASDTLAYVEPLKMLYQKGTDGRLVGVAALRNLSGFRSLANGSAKTGFTDLELHSLISNTSVQIDSTAAGDQMFMVSSGSFTLEISESRTVAFAVVVAETESELLENAARARNRYDLATGIDSDALTTLPDRFELFQNYPNPFNPTTSIAFRLARSEQVTLAVYNMLGQQVSVLHNGFLEAGEHVLDWNATDQDGSRVASGVYFYRLSADGISTAKKMVLLK